MVIKFISFIFLLFFFSSCQSKIPKVVIPPKDTALTTPLNPPATAPNIENIFEWNCDEPSFSDTGEQLIFWCSMPGFLKQQQVFIKDLSTSKVKQITFINGRIAGPQMVKQDVIVFSSDTDKIKEILTLDPNELEKDNYFELYMYNLSKDEMMRLTNDSLPEGKINFINHIDPKIIYVKTTNKKSELILKNLQTLKEKTIYTTDFPILELKVDTLNQVLITEEFNGKKMIKLRPIENQKSSLNADSTWPLFENTQYNFYFNGNNNSLEYLEKKGNKTFLKAYNFSDKCENELFVFQNENVSLLQRLANDSTTFAWVERANGIKKINLGSLSLNTKSSCQKVNQ